MNTKQQALMNQYVADLAVLNVKFHNLHWNVVGERFVPVHVYLEEQYDDFFEKYDEVAERLKMLGEFAPASMSEYLKLTSVEELENRDYPIADVYKIVQAEFNNLKALVTDIRNLADEAGDFVTVGLMEDHVADFDKQLWFIAQSLK